MRADEVRRVENATSERIQSARVISIFFMTYAHVSPGIAEADFQTHAVRGADLVFFFLGSMVAKCAVPLLSIVSGWLLFGSLQAKSYRQIARGKVWTLLVPMVLWNAILLALISGFVVITKEPHWLPQNIVAWINALFSLTAVPANIQLAFLRDLFVCALAAPALVWIGRRTPLALIAGLALAAILVPPNPVVLRPEIAFFFGIGLLLRMNAIRFDWIDRFGINATIAFGLTGILLLYLQMQGLAGSWSAPQWVTNTLVLVVRLSAALFFWWLAGVLLRTALAPVILAAGEIVFLVFCSHVILFKVLSLIGRDVLGGYYGDWYALYFMVQPLAAFLAGWLLYRALQAMAPGALALLTGGTHTRPRPSLLNRTGSRR